MSLFFNALRLVLYTLLFRTRFHREFIGRHSSGDTGPGQDDALRQNPDTHLLADDGQYNKIGEPRRYG
jgi:hypothetical protein